ncbi:DUF3291 domain-containing protein [Larkinella insperata]|uniref:DUF3291 domain-containing protein n=1 Tax=Larkinella insperata TaxID=332158 RepID=A0ABW3QEB5_9BACT|nr:DUF3291 domain-containing protein [Larkinella insperata]
MATYQLAQVNVAQMLAPLDSPLMADFVANLDPINALADQSPGFVWRLKTEEGDATAIQAFDDNLILVNLSVWETIDALKNYTYHTAHTAIMKRRREWFSKFQGAYMVLWWIEAGHFPTPLEARQRLNALSQLGPTPYAFTFRHSFESPASNTETKKSGPTEVSQI